MPEALFALVKFATFGPAIAILQLLARRKPMFVSAAAGIGLALYALVYVIGNLWLLGVIH